MTCRWWFSPSACFLLARNKFPFSLTLDILFKLDRGGWMPNRKWPSKMQINLWQNLFVHLLYVSILNLWHCVYHKYDLAASSSLLLQQCSVFIRSKKWIFHLFFYTTSSTKACLRVCVFHNICHYLKIYHIQLLSVVHWMCHTSLHSAEFLTFNLL